MKKTFMGVRLRKLRAERGMTQVALAQALGLSPSYLNQLEQNQRPLTVPVLIFGVSASYGAVNDPQPFLPPFLILVALTLFYAVIGPLGAALALKHATD